MGLLIKNEIDIQCCIGNTSQVAVYNVRFVVKVMKYGRELSSQETRCSFKTPE